MSEQPENLSQSVEAEANKQEAKPKGSKPKRTKPKAKRGRGASKPFPNATFESVLPLGKTIFDHAGASREMRRLTVFDKLGKGPESGPSRMLVTNSNKYGLTLGSLNSEHLKLTDSGVLVFDPATPMRKSTQAKFELAIKRIPPFNALYEKFKDGKLPASEVMKDSLQEYKMDAEDLQACVDIFVENAKYVGLLKVLSGAERLLSIQHVLEELGPIDTTVSGSNDQGQQTTGTEENGQPAVDPYSVCFFIAPIGPDGSPERKHSDMVLSSLVERAVEPLKLQVIRADKITSPGMISKQIIEHILKSRVVIVDMSFHNPNVFYELALRHAIGKPIVHLIRKTDKIPFDVGNFRTIQIDDTDMYDLIAKLDTYRAEIANQVRQVLDGMASGDNPILSFCPGLKVTI